MKRARGAHIVIRGLGWKQREDRGSKMASGRSLYSRCFPACNYLPRPRLAHARSLARSLLRVLLRESSTFTTTYLANQPVARSLTRSLARPSIYAPSSFLPQCSRTGCSEGSRVPRKKPWVYLYERSHKSRRSSSVSRLTLVGYGSRSTGYDPYCRVYPLHGPV